MTTIPCKICSCCKTEKTIIHFYKRKGLKHGVNCICKECFKLKHFNRGRTKPGLLSKIYQRQARSSKARGHEAPKYSKEDFKSWVMRRNKFHLLFDYWKQTGFEKKHTPSIDRKDDNLGYSFKNIQLMTWGENRDKYINNVIRTDKNPKNKPVIQYNLKGEFVNEFISVKQAKKETNAMSISQVCLGKRKTSKGFKWKFKTN